MTSKKVAHTSQLVKSSSHKSRETRLSKTTTSQWVVSHNMPIPSVSSNFHSTSPKRYSVRERNISTDDQQKLCSHQPPHQIPPLTVRRDTVSENASSQWMIIQSPCSCHPLHQIPTPQLQREEKNTGIRQQPRRKKK
jgi:hypothetical protein